MKNASNYRKFLLLWAGEFVSAIGGGLTSFGLGVYVFSQTGSAACMSLITLLAFLPTLLLSAPAGVLADRYDRRVLMMIGDGLSALGLIYIFVCMLTGGAKLYQICIGVLISSVFSSLLGPAYKATVSDLLTEAEYAKASGMVSIASSARYLISPLLAGLLLSFSDIKLLLLIDISTFFLTVISTFVVKKGLPTRTVNTKESFHASLKIGWNAITEKRGIVLLIALSSVMTCFMGAVQILAEPLILDFASSTVLGIAETFCSCGMLITSVLLGLRGIRKGYVRILSLSLVFAGAAMFLLGIKENIYLICAGGFLFFSMLPPANTCMDYLIRSNIAAEHQGRAWGLIGFLSQIGYIVSYGISGLLADWIAVRFGIGVGRGAGIVICISGFLLAALALIAGRFKTVRALEHRPQEPDWVQENAMEKPDGAS